MNDSNHTDHAIYVFFHKYAPLVSKELLYKPIQAGKALLKEESHYPGDDTGDHISDKNQYYSELSGIYWVWKNTRHSIVGSCHYRRFFTTQPLPLVYKFKHWLLHPFSHKNSRGLWYSNNYEKHRNMIMTESDMIGILEEYDAILPVPRKFRYSIEKHYRKYHDKADLELVRQILADRHPDYLDSFDQTLKSDKLYANNMFMLKSEHFQSFMEWWFDILFRFEEQTPIEKYTGYQQRIFGFMAERLLTVWFSHQKLKVKELPLLYFKRLKYN